MSEISYSKKQLGPLITKFAINVEKNTLFNDIINLFAGSPNYHVWAVKSVFSRATDFETLRLIKAWSDGNQNAIKLLSKNGNITSYSTPADFTQLVNEMHNIDRINLVKQVANTFNTDQKNIILLASDIANVNSLNADKNTKFMGWFDLLNKFRKLHMTKRNSTIKVMSAVRNESDIRRLINDALKKSYVWDKEDMLNFVTNNTPDVRVVYNMGPIVILEIPSFNDSHTLCYGRTEWCITRDEYQFKNYVLNHKGNRQFFFFNFDKPEKDDLAYVGFTISPKEGVYAGHTRSNNNMLGSGASVNGERWTVQKLLSHHGVGMGIFLNLKEMKGWTWNIESLTEFIKTNKNANIVYRKGNVLVVKVETQASLKSLIGFTFISLDNFAFNDKSQTYVVFDFDKKLDDNNSVLALNYQIDRYQFLSNKLAFNTFGSDVMKENPLGKLGISSDEFLHREPIDPNILLHKYIDEREEDAAVKVINDNTDKINVNFKLEDRLPIYSTIENKMFKAFTAIVNHKSFDGNFDDGNGASIPQIILWAHYITPDYKKDETVDNLLIGLIESGKFDLNYIDANEDTLINVAAISQNCNWLVDYLVKRPEVNINAVNDIGYTAFGNAIRYNNFEAARMLGSRPDIKLSDNDVNVAKSKKIKLEDYLVPSTDRVQTASANTTGHFESNANYADVLSKLFNNK